MGNLDFLSVKPGKIVAVGLNYKEHARELQMDLPLEPLIFMKPASSLIGQGEAIILPPQSARVEYEAELALVMGKTAKNVRAASALDYVAGFTCLNDVTARDLQKKDGQWTRAKSFDTFCPVGPGLVLARDIDPKNLAIKLYLNGELRQSGNTADLIFPVEELIAFISQIMTLDPGDIITTGTPPGVGILQPGDTVEVEIAGIGVLSNPVQAAG